MKNTLFIAGVIFLAGCGGGSGDGGSSSLPDPKSEHSKDYDASLLEAYFHANNTKSDTLGLTLNTVSAKLQYKDNTRRNVYLSGTDEIEVLADGVKLQSNQVIDSTLFFTAPASSVGIYEFIWRRDGQVIAKASLGDMPVEFTSTVTYDGDKISYSWPEESDHKYTYIAAGLSCDNNAFTKYYSANENWRDNVISGGSISFDLAQAFAVTDANLRSTYTTCTVITDIIAEDTNLSPQLSGSNIKVDARFSELSYKTLF